MASYTTNLNLKKPAGSENVSIGDINNNMDLIDQAYGEMNADITDNVPSKITRLPSSLGCTVSMANSSRHLLIFTGAGLGRFGMVLVNVTAGSVVTYETIFKGDSLTITTDTNTIEFTISGSSVTNITLSDWALNGNLATVTEN